jgi:hypothetical protein
MRRAPGPGVGTVRLVTAVLAVCLALAVVAAVWLGARSSRLSTRLAEATGKVTSLEEAAEAAEAERSSLAASLATSTADATEATSRADAADAARRNAETDLAAAREATAAAEARAVEAETRREEADDRSSAATAALEQALAERSDPRPEGWSGPEPEVLWALERTRTERTWRTSVAADPTSSAFEPAQDVLRRAVEIDLAALREEVGVEFALTWDVDVELPHLTSLAVLRTTQELVAAATRLADEATVSVATNDGDIVITLLEANGDAGRFADLATELATDLDGPGLEAVPGGVRLAGAVPAPPT